MNAHSDAKLGMERALHEMRWMARGYVAYLHAFINELADEMEAAWNDCGGTYFETIRTARIRVLNAKEDLTIDIFKITCDQVAHRLAQIPEDPLDEPKCQRHDGQLPTTSRGYKETAHV